MASTTKAEALTAERDSTDLAPQKKVARPPYSHSQAFAHYRSSLERRAAEVKRKMGARLLTHPDYRPDPRHSLREEIWTQARAPWWERAALAAQQARNANPEYHRAQASIRAQIANYQGAQA